MVNHLVLLLLLTLRTPAEGGCGIPAFAGGTGSELHFVVLQASRPAEFAVDVETLTGRAIPAAPRAVAVKPGTGDRAWTASRTMDDDRRVLVSDRLSTGECMTIGAIDLGARPVAFTWTEDREGIAWLFFETIGDEGRRVQAYRQRGPKWEEAGSIRGGIRTPRLDRVTNRIYVGPLVFSSDLPPERWLKDETLPAGVVADLLDIFPMADGTLLAVDPRRGVWHRAAAADWNRIATPWDIDSSASIVPSDDPSPIVAWKRRPDDLVVSAWHDGAWLTLGVLSRADAIEGGGPLIMRQGKIVLLGVCYHFSHPEWVAVTLFDGNEHTSLKLPIADLHSP